MLSMVAKRRSAESRSVANVPKARHAPLNSSIPAISPRISGVIRVVSVLSGVQVMPEYAPNYTQLGNRSSTPIYAYAATPGGGPTVSIIDSAGGRGWPRTQSYRAENTPIHSFKGAEKVWSFVKAHRRP